MTACEQIKLHAVVVDCFTWFQQGCRETSTSVCIK